MEGRGGGKMSDIWNQKKKKGTALVPVGCRLGGEEHGGKEEMWRKESSLTDICENIGMQPFQDHLGLLGEAVKRAILQFCTGKLEHKLFS